MRIPFNLLRSIDTGILYGTLLYKIVFVVQGAKASAVIEDNSMEFETVAIVFASDDAVNSRLLRTALKKTKNVLFCDPLAKLFLSTWTFACIHKTSSRH